MSQEGLLVANSASREHVYGRNFETVGPGVRRCEVPEGDAIMMLQHEDEVGVGAGSRRLLHNARQPGLGEALRQLHAASTERQLGSARRPHL